MALIELNSPGPAFDPARLAKTFHDSGLPVEALERLPQLHQEAGRNLELSHFLGRSPIACVALMSMGAVALVWADASGGGTLKADFGWAALVLLGVVAMTRNFIRGYARSLRRVPLEEAAADLRMLLLYTGMVWGGGALLVMPGLPAPALVYAFAVAPSLALTLALRDDRGRLAFVAPASLIPAGAALLGAWPLASWVAGVIVATNLSLVLVPMLRRAMRRNILPGILPRPVLR